MCVYYHASLEKFNIGHTVSVDGIQGRTIRDHAKRSLEQQIVNERLDTERPLYKYSRKRCIFPWRLISGGKQIRFPQWHAAHHQSHTEQQPGHGTHRDWR